MEEEELTTTTSTPDGTESGSTDTPQAKDWEQEYKNYQASQTKQRQEYSKKEKLNDSYKTSVSQVTKLPGNEGVLKIAEIYEEDSDLGKMLLETFFDGIDYEDFVQQHLGQDDQPKLKKIDLEKVKAKAKEEAKLEYEKDDADKYVDYFFKEKLKGLSKADIDEVRESRQDIVGDRHYTKDYAKKRLTKLSVSYSKGTSDDVIKSQALGASAGGSSKSTEKSKYADLYKQIS